VAHNFFAVVLLISLVLFGRSIRTCSERDA
jgi:hypothetical protein